MRKGSLWFGLGLGGSDQGLLDHLQPIIIKNSLFAAIMQWVLSGLSHKEEVILFSQANNLPVWETPKLVNNEQRATISWLLPGSFILPCD